MINFVEITLKDLLEEIGEDKIVEILSDFYCPKNEDVERFLKEKSITFEINDISRTCLIFAHGSDNNLILVGYYSIAQKPFNFTDGVSRKIRKEIASHHFFMKQPLPALLLGQIGKSFSEKAHRGGLIKGRDLLHYAFTRMKSVYKLIPFKLIYVECHDVKELREFYENPGFTLHADNQGKPYKNDKKDEYLIYLANSSILRFVE